MATYIKIQTVTVGAGGAANVEFTNIPQTYTDLKVLHSFRNVGANNVGTLRLYFNGDTSNRTSRVLYGETTGQGTFTSTQHAGYSVGANQTANIFASSEVYIPNYIGSTFKSVSHDSVTEGNASGYQSGVQALVAGLWSSTAAITSIRFTDAGGNFAQHSTATLYGIKSS